MDDKKIIKTTGRVWSNPYASFLTCPSSHWVVTESVYFPSNENASTRVEYFCPGKLIRDSVWALFIPFVRGLVT